VHFSVVWWRTLHQPATVLSPDPAPMDERMALALLLAVVSFSVAGWLVLRRRVRTLAERDGAPPPPQDLPAGAPLVVRAGGRS
jgi:heme exporter protein C